MSLMHAKWLSHAICLLNIQSFCITVVVDARKEFKDIYCPALAGRNITVFFETL